MDSKSITMKSKMQFTIVKAYENKQYLSHLIIEHNSDNLTQFWFLVRISFNGSFEPQNEVHPKNSGQ